MDMATDDTFSRTSDRMPSTFTSLPKGFFSLAQEADYYEALHLLPEGTAETILNALNDVANGRVLSFSVSDHRVYEQSLRRSVTDNDYRRMVRTARGGKRSLPFACSYTPPAEGLLPPHRFDFHAEPESLPPTNLHALIGRNGVGKSHLLHAIAEDVTAGIVEVRSGAEDDEQVRLSGCVVVSLVEEDERLLGHKIGQPGDGEQHQGVAGAELLEDRDWFNGVQMVWPGGHVGFVVAQAACVFVDG
ncbi:hypothetical protein OG625_34490 [Streptomyces sp. NBC_01351]|uniref:hypothetical protein n=1 Tax=Streptomyces sp. NBC_01351 TaxID=2903833 RepID=UPI002E31028F|nr:hypothetical protein [Streptomyces sp. NBC_01351]